MMLEIQIDTTNLERKLADTRARIRNSTVSGLEEYQAKQETEIDNFMFVPLEFDSEIQQLAGETILTTAINLNLPPQNRRRFTRKERAWYRVRQARKARNRKRWWDYVAELLTGQKQKVTKELSESIQEGLK